MAPPEAPTDSTLRRHGRSWLVLMAVLAAVLLLFVLWFVTQRPFAVEPDTGAAPMPTSEPAPEPTGGSDGGPAPGGSDGMAASIAAFSERCADGIDEWRTGRLDYPDTLVVGYPGSVTYNAAVDAREVPVPADEVIDAGEGTATSEQVLLQCRVGARLVAVGEHLTVLGEGDGDWTYKEWSPLGVLEWSWSVTAREPVDQEVRLDLRPAVVADDVSLGAQGQLSVTTDVDVRASVIQRFGYWVETEWVVLWGGLVVLGGAFLAIRSGFRKLRKGDS